MSPWEIVELVREWFGAHRTASLILPDGWFGRPYDNQHVVTLAAGSNGHLVIELDDEIVLIASAAGLTAETLDHECRISGPGSLVMTPNGYGSTGSRTFSQVLIRFVEPGAVV